MCPTCLTRRKLLLGAAFVPFLGACDDSAQQAKTIQPAEIEQDTACSLDGMLLADYPGPKAQIHYDGIERPDFFCDTVEMFAIFLNPEQVRKITALFVQDMAKTDWDAPRGAWMDARQAFYVVKSSRMGSMGPTFAPFSQQADAQSFVDTYGGEIKRFDEVTPEMAVLDGGALHDHMM